jgi:peptidoglycan/LPS O-acetylase OafA/YrhL
VSTTDVSVHRHRIDYLDGLRAVAVLAVLVSHVALHGLHGAAYRTLMEGAHGVDLFFVISGFCLAFPTLAKRQRGTTTVFDVVDFGAKRLVRIVPPFYLATAVLLALAVVPHFVTHHSVQDGLPDARSLGASLLFLDDHVQLMNGSFWTLMVEFRPRSSRSSSITLPAHAGWTSERCRASCSGSLRPTCTSRARARRPGVARCGVGRGC